MACKDWADDTVGPHERFQRIGQGGLGLVSMAEQHGRHVVDSMAALSVSIEMKFSKRLGPGVNDAGQRPDVATDVAPGNASYGSGHWRIQLMDPEAMATTNPYEKLAEAAARGTRATVWGIVASSLLAAVKIIGGILGNSYALIADGIESMLDIMSSLIVWGSLSFSTQPADDEHPYGYGKVESLAALVVATALFAAALGITIQSIREIRTPHHTPAGFTLIILIGVVIAKESMFRLLFRTGETIGSTSMQTDAWHHRSDSLTSIAAFIGISIALIAGKGYEAADDWAALFAAAVIAFNGTRLFRSAWREVLDVSPPPEVVANVRSVAQAVESVVEIEKCRIRKSGLGMFVDIHVVVDGDMTVRDGHALSHQVKDRLLEEVPGIQDVLVHVEPSDE